MQNITTGDRFGLWRAVHADATRRGGNSFWICVCDCGTRRSVQASRLTEGGTRSCGCQRRENTRKMMAANPMGHGYKHGMCKTPTYHSWFSMMKRGHFSTPKNGSDYFAYKGRGISVCERWHVFQNFFADMGTRPEGHTLDRIYHNGNYELGNCRWATSKQQNNNKRSNRFLSLNGETKTLAQWAESLGISSQSINTRLKNGWPVEAALTTKRLWPRGRYKHAAS